MTWTIRWAWSSAALAGLSQLSRFFKCCQASEPTATGVSLSTSRIGNSSLFFDTAWLNNLYALFRGPQATICGILPANPAFSKKRLNPLRHSILGFWPPAVPELPPSTKIFIFTSAFPQALRSSKHLQARIRQASLRGRLCQVSSSRYGRRGFHTQ